MSTYNLGRVLPIFKGLYSATETYENLDVVFYNGSSYVANGSTTGNLPTDTDYWTLVAQAGTLDETQIEAIEAEVLVWIQQQGYVVDNDYTHTDNNFTDAEKSKLSGIAEGAEVNVNADWNATSGDAKILNKPTIPTATSQLSNDSGFLTEHQSLKTINNQSIVGSGNITIEGGGSGTTDYTELTNKPSINGVELSGDKSTSDLGISIPDSTSDLTNDSGFITKDVNNLSNYYTQSSIRSILNNYQSTLVSGTNIKTINNQSILGSGNITIEGGSGGSGIPAPNVVSVSDTSWTLAEMAYNTVYTCSNPLTALNITAFSSDYVNLETVIYFTTDSTGCTYTMPTGTKYSPLQFILNASTSYVMVIENGIVSIAQITE